MVVRGNVKRFLSKYGTTVDVLQENRSQDGSGGVTTEFIEIDSNVPARFRKRVGSPSEERFGEKETARIDKIMYTSTDADVSRDNRIVPNGLNERYKVIDVHGDENKDSHYEIDLEEITDA